MSIHDPKLGKAQYAVGYCKPPQATQFKKGKSGNPSGKKSGTHSFKKIFLEVAGELVVTRDSNGKKKKKPFLEFVIESAVRHAINGKSQLLPQVAKLLQEFSPPDMPEVPNTGKFYKEGDKVLYKFWFDPTPEEKAQVEALRYILDLDIGPDPDEVLASDLEIVPFESDLASNDGVAGE
jgi:hypothetical protein